MTGTRDVGMTRLPAATYRPEMYATAVCLGRRVKLSKSTSRESEMWRVSSETTGILTLAVERQMGEGGDAAGEGFRIGSSLEERKTRAARGPP